jgi:hypothetical protein
MTTIPLPPGTVVTGAGSPTRHPAIALDGGINVITDTGAVHTLRDPGVCLIPAPTYFTPPAGTVTPVLSLDDGGVSVSWATVALGRVTSEGGYHSIEYLVVDAEGCTSVAFNVARTKEEKESALDMLVHYRLSDPALDTQWRQALKELRALLMAGEWEC